jgi:hypothetical protein
LKTTKTILYIARTEKTTTLKDSWGMGNHFVCMRYVKSGAVPQTIVHTIKMPRFMIVHHMKNVVSVGILMMFSVISF